MTGPRPFTRCAVDRCSRYGTQNLPCGEHALDIGVCEPHEREIAAAQWQWRLCVRPSTHKQGAFRTIVTTEEAA